MSDDDWDLIIKVHVKGAYKVSAANYLSTQIITANRRLLVCKSCMAAL